MLAIVLCLLFLPIGILSSSNIQYYPLIPVATNSVNISSFNSCLCACVSCYDCRYFSYWSSAACQLYNMYQDKPDIANYTRMMNDNQTGLYIVVPSGNVCQWSQNFTLSLDYKSRAPQVITQSGMNIVNLLNIDGNLLLAIDKNSSSYYFIDQDTFEIVGNGTLSSNCSIVCARKFLSGPIFLCCASGTIEVYQLMSNVTVNQQNLTFYSVYNTTGGIPQDLIRLNGTIILYVISNGNVYQLSTPGNVDKLIISLNTSSFLAPYNIFTADESNQLLYLVNTNGTLFRLPIVINNSSLNVSLYGIDIYHLLIPQSASISFDLCNYLSVLSSSMSLSYQAQMIRFDTTSGNGSLSSFPITNVTNILPIDLFNSTVNFLFTNNYSLYINNQNSLYRITRQPLC